MPNTRSAAAIAGGKLIQKVDDARPATGDNHKLPGFLRAEVNADVAALIPADALTAETAGDLAGANASERTALIDLNGFVHDVFNHVKGIRSSKITADERRELFILFGFPGGEVGEITDGRVVTLATLAVLNNPKVGNPLWSLPADLTEDIQDRLDIVEDEEADRAPGDASGATRHRNDLMRKLERTISRCFHYYSCVTDLVDQNPELANIGGRPRRAYVRRKKPGTPPTPPTGG